MKNININFELKVSMENLPVEELKQKVSIGVMDKLELEERMERYLDTELHLLYIDALLEGKRKFREMIESSEEQRNLEYTITKEKESK